MDEQLPGTKRGGKGTFGGRGGALKLELKLAAIDLVVQCNVPLRNVPKVFAVAQTGLLMRPPKQDELFSKTHLAQWLIELSASHLRQEIDTFWSVRVKFPEIQLHIGHDATERTTREVGKSAKLMQYYASYFNPDCKQAVKFIVSLRALPGSGSAPATARALAVILSDMDALDTSASQEDDVAFNVGVLPKGKGSICDLGSDNTGSAINVARQLSLLTGEDISSYPCPTHMNALDGLNPLQAAFGKKPSSGGTTNVYDVPHVLNVHAKLSYVWGKHAATIGTWYQELGLQPEWKHLMRPPDGQIGKWESMGPSLAYLVNHSPRLRLLFARVEHMTKGIDALGTLSKDAGLLWRWLCDSDIYFGILTAHSWFENTIEPIYEFLHSPSTLHPESGPHFRRQDMPRLALNALHRALSFFPHGASDEDIKKVAEKHIPNALQMLEDAIVQRVGSAAHHFEVTSQDQQRLLRQWHDGYRGALMTNYEKHWSKFLSGSELFGLATDFELGPYFVRLLLHHVLPVKDCQKLASAHNLILPTTCACSHEAPASKLAPLIDKLFKENSGSILASFQKLGLADGGIRKADWFKLADPLVHSELNCSNWSRAVLPGLAPFFENKFFGGMHTQLPLEQVFSVYGQHVRKAQSMPLKEAIVMLNVRLAGERTARCHESLRAKPLTSAQRAALNPKQQHSGEIVKSDETRAQLVLMCEQLILRMSRTTLDDFRRGAVFAKKRKISWVLLGLREKKKMKGSMYKKRKAGRIQLPTGLFAVRRAEKSHAQQAQYMLEAETAVAKSV